MQTRLALQGAGYRWNDVPISESVGVMVPNANSRKEQFDLAMLRRAQQGRASLPSVYSPIPRY